MANVNNPYGLRLIGHLYGGIPRVRTYYVNDAGTAGIFIGDVVKHGGTSKSDGYPTCQISTNGSTLNLGVVVGIVRVGEDTEFAAPAIPSHSWIPDDKSGYVAVCDDPYAIYVAQEDSVGGDIADTSIGEFCDLIAASGNTTTGKSQWMIDSSDATTGDGVLLMKRYQAPENENGTYCQFEIMFNEHAFKAVGLPT